MDKSHLAATLTPRAVSSGRGRVGAGRETLWARVGPQGRVPAQRVAVRSAVELPEPRVTRKCLKVAARGTEPHFEPALPDEHQRDTMSLTPGDLPASYPPLWKT